MWISNRLIIMYSNILNFVKRSYEILLPESCLLCDTSNINLCTDCIISLEKSYQSGSPDSKAFLNYKDRNVRKILHYIKYYNQPYLAHKILDSSISDIKNFISLHQMTDFIIMPIPADNLRMLSRGYNQAAIIAEYISNKLSSQGIKHNYSDILYRSRHLKKLSHLSGGVLERQSLLKGAYKIKEGDNVDLKGKSILLIDDITTSGSTFYESKETLYNAGAAKVILYSLAH